MNSLRRSWIGSKGGYTIIELMIVLVVSTALFTTAVVGYSRQNNRTHFSQAVKDLEIKLQDTLNDVGTGYYANAGNFACKRQGSPAVPKVTPAAQAQGTNQDCIFAGRAIDLRSVSGDHSYEIYTIVGLRNQSGDNTKLATDLSDSANRAIVNNAISGAIEGQSLDGSIDIANILDGDGSANTPINAFAVISGFGTGSNGSGATTNQVSIASIPTFNFGSETVQAVDQADLDKTVTICIEETGGGAGARHAIITIGSGSKINIETQVDITWPAGC